VQIYLPIHEPSRYDELFDGINAFVFNN
jgi:hypothetical protein